MPPDIFADYNSIGALFVEASGLTETLQGKGTKDVRSKGHAKQMLTTGSGRIKKLLPNWKLHWCAWEIWLSSSTRGTTTSRSDRTQRMKVNRAMRFFMPIWQAIIR